MKSTKYNTSCEDKVFSVLQDYLSNRKATELQGCKEPPEMMLYNEAGSRVWHVHGLVSSLQQTAIQSPRYFSISSHPRMFLVAACSPTPFLALISTFRCPSHLSGLLQQMWTPVFWHQHQPFCGSHMASKPQTCLPRQHSISA